jgi:hypothetical protein
MNKWVWAQVARGGYMSGILTSLFYHVVTTNMVKRGYNSFAVVQCNVFKRFMIFNLDLSLYYLNKKMMFKKLLTCD